MVILVCFSGFGELRKGVKLNKVISEETITKMRPYERCEHFGARYLSDSELLAVILRTGHKGREAVQVADEILNLNGEVKGLLGLQRCSIDEFMRVKGVGRVKAIELACVVELSRRIAKTNREKTLCFNKPETIAAYYMEDFRHKQCEEVMALLLNVKSMLIKEVWLSKGTVNASFASPRELFIEALKMEAVNIILLHNHPSGDPTPSGNDIENTKRIMEAGKIIGINLIDHIIIGDNSYISLRKDGLF
ncbi:MAG: DNA repair protein RadC [Lachnospiraceae bacterium]|nr:DNA repair protein RadC [Lachnospiraceae bacterium]